MGKPFHPTETMTVRRTAIVPSYGNNDRGYGNEQRPFNQSSRPNFDNRPSRPVPNLASAAEGDATADGIKKRRPRVGDTRVNSYDNEIIAAEEDLHLAVIVLLMVIIAVEVMVTVRSRDVLAIIIRMLSITSKSSLSIRKCWQIRTNRSV